MEKIIEIDLIESSDLFERYNRKKVSKDLIEYIIDNSFDFKKKDTIKIIINNKLKEKSTKLIYEGLKTEYNKNLKKYFYNNLIQIIYLIAGIITLFLSTKINGVILREIVLIGGWVLIWSMVELEIFTDMAGRKRRKILKKLLNSEFIENNP